MDCLGGLNTNNWVTIVSQNLEKVLEGATGVMENTINSIKRVVNAWILGPK
jgi:hypothetical protein